MNLRFSARLALIVAISAFASGVKAQTPDPSGGRKLAFDFCAGCHQVQQKTTEPSPNPDAPPFALVAATPSLTDLAIRVFLRSPHSSMPNFLLSDTDIDGIIAYLRTFHPE